MYIFTYDFVQYVLRKSVYIFTYDFVQYVHVKLII